MDPSQICSLRQEVEKTFGRRVLSSADCRNLSIEISSQSKFEVSFNTLRRFFNLMKPAHHPSLFTLNVLASYCGYSSFDDFVTTSKSALDLGGSQSSGLLNYLVMLFRDTELNGTNDLTYFRMVQQTIGYLEQHAYLIDRFQREIAKTSNGQQFYFEHLVHVDKLNSFYGDGLRYYLLEKKTPEAQVFGHSLLCFRNWLTMDYDGVEKHYKALLEINVDKTIQPRVSGRFFAAQLYHADVLGMDPSCIIAKARAFYAAEPPEGDSFTLCNNFEMVLAEALVLTGQYQEALFYIDEFISNIKTATSSFVVESAFQKISLYKAMAYALTGNKTKALKKIQEIRPYAFCTLSRQYLTLLYLSLKNGLRDRVGEEEQLAHLEKQTGFSRLLFLWSKSFASINKYA